MQTPGGLLGQFPVEYLSQTPGTLHGQPFGTRGGSFPQQLPAQATASSLLTACFPQPLEQLFAAQAMRALQQFGAHQLQQVFGLPHPGLSPSHPPSLHQYGATLPGQTLNVLQQPSGWYASHQPQVQAPGYGYLTPQYYATPQYQVPAPAPPQPMITYAQYSPAPVMQQHHHFQPTAPLLSAPASAPHSPVVTPPSLAPAAPAPVQPAVNAQDGVAQGLRVPHATGPATAALPATAAPPTTAPAGPRTAQGPAPANRAQQAIANGEQVTVLRRPPPAPSTADAPRKVSPAGGPGAEPPRAKVTSPHECERVFDVPSPVAGVVIGKGGWRVKAIRSSTAAVTVSEDRPRSIHVVRLAGTTQAVDAAEIAVTEVVDKALARLRAEKPANRPPPLAAATTPIAPMEDSAPRADAATTLAPAAPALASHSQERVQSAAKQRQKAARLARKAAAKPSPQSAPTQPASDHAGATPPTTRVTPAAPAASRSGGGNKEVRLRTPPVRRSHLGKICGLASCNLRSIERTTRSTITVVDNRHLRAAYFIVTGSADGALKAKEAVEDLALRARDGGEVQQPQSAPATEPPPAQPALARATARLPTALEPRFGPWLKRQVNGTLGKGFTSELVKDLTGWAVHVYGRDDTATRQTASALESLFASLSSPPTMSKLSQSLQTPPAAPASSAQSQGPTVEEPALRGPTDGWIPPDLDDIRAVAAITDPAALLHLAAFAVSQDAVNPPSDSSLTEWAVAIAYSYGLTIQGFRRVLLTMAVRAKRNVDLPVTLKSGDRHVRFSEVEALAPPLVVPPPASPSEAIANTVPTVDFPDTRAMVQQYLQLHHDASIASKDTATTVALAAILSNTEWVLKFAGMIDQSPHGGFKLEALNRLVQPEINRVIERSKLRLREINLAIAHADALVRSAMGKAMFELKEGDSETTTSIVTRWANLSQGSTGIRGIVCAAEHLGRSFRAAHEAAAGKQPPPVYVPLPQFGETLRNLTHYTAIWIALWGDTVDPTGWKDPSRTFDLTRLNSANFYSAAAGALSLKQSTQVSYAIRALPQLPSLDDVEQAVAAALSATDFPPSPPPREHMSTQRRSSPQQHGADDYDYSLDEDAPVDGAAAAVANLTISPPPEQRAPPSTPAASVGRGRSLQRSRR